MSYVSQGKERKWSVTLYMSYVSQGKERKWSVTLYMSYVSQGKERKWSVTLYMSYVSQVPASLSPSDELPSGLILLKDFVSPDYGNKLLTDIKWNEDESMGLQKELKHREVKHYGYEFKYGINDVDIDDPLPQGIPGICQELLDRVLTEGHVKHFPDQVTVNKYQPGQGIPPHVDTPAAFEDGIMSLSLGSQVLMDFRHPNGKHLTVLLPPNSLLIMTGESRYLWSHGITPRKSDIIPTADGRLTLIHRSTRTSYTFRKIIPPRDRINRHIPFSTGQPNPTKLAQSSADAACLEESHVHKVYEEIADHFSGTRHSPWPKIADFIRAQPTGSILADIGCGNGKYLGINKDIFEVGSDRSYNLAKICRSREFQVFVSDVMSIPIRSGACDICLCIAVLHHLSTEERRLHGISELLRILRPGGKVLIYVWAMEQELHKVKSKYLKEVKGNKTTQAFDNSQTTQAIDNSARSSSQLHSSDKVIDKLSSAQSGKMGNVSVTNECEDEHIDGQVNITASTCDQKPELTPRTCESCGETGQCISNMLEIHKNRTKFKQQDMLVPWQLKKEQGECVFHRYYHVFRQGELETLCKRLDNCTVIESYYDQGNWAVILQKL
ncbi:alkylated DNA repair protein alkB homolog 8-like isoform X2 [Argopecten irradians]|uniref:alkylated DNA repair protein alkB homolog 8-like isoform X2 n=1 Tax=Argopecten irradians TaxID=31199 RepID=UPI003720EBEA